MIDLAPDRVALFGYAHLPSRLPHQRRVEQAGRILSGQERAALLLLGIERMTSAGYLRVSAISSTPRMHWQSHADLPSWEHAVAAPSLPVARGIELDADDRLRRSVIGRLMCDAELDLRRLGVEHDIDAAAYFEAELAAIGRLGELVHYDPSTQTLRATELGRLLIRNICIVFDRHDPEAALPGAAPGAPSRFSPAI